MLAAPFIAVNGSPAVARIGHSLMAMGRKLHNGSSKTTR
jgi:hypothetical protein